MVGSDCPRQSDPTLGEDKFRPVLEDGDDGEEEDAADDSSNF